MTKSSKVIGVTFVILVALSVAACEDKSLYPGLQQIDPTNYLDGSPQPVTDEYNPAGNAH